MTDSDGLGFEISRLVSLLMMWVRAAHFSVNIQEYLALNQLYVETEGLPQYMLCQQGISAATVSALVDRLFKKSLVIRTQNPFNRRENIVLLTDSGTRLAERMLGSIEALFTGLSRDTVRELKRLMTLATDEMEKNLERESV